MSSADAFREDQALQEGVGGEPVRAVHARAGHLAARVQTRDRRTAVQVRPYAAGRVVGRRGDRDRLGDRVDAVGAAGRQDGREAGLPHLGAEVPGVEVHVLGALLAHPPHDALGDDVAGGQLRQFVLPDHEAHAVRVDQVGALAAHRLGDQRLLALRVGAQEEHGGVELDEFEVRDLRTGAQGERDAVARRDGRVGGGREDLPHAAGGEDDGRGADGADSVVLAFTHDVQGDARRAPVGVRQQVQDQGVLDRTERGGPYGLDERPGDLRAGRVAARVGDAAAVVAALAGELDGARVGVGVEEGAGVDQAAYGVRALGDQGPYGLLVAQARARDERVVQVLFGGVPVAEGGGNAALRPARGAVVEAGLGDDDRAQAGGGAAQGGGEAGDAGADDHDVGLDGPAGGGGLQPYTGTGHAEAPCSLSWLSSLPSPTPWAKVSGMLSISRVAPTLAATARTASPR